MSETVHLSPRQRDCLRLVWERQATSKEIGLALGISSKTVDSHIEAAMELLGANDRRRAAALVFGERVGVAPDGVMLPVAPAPAAAPETVVSTHASWLVRAGIWRAPDRRNALSLVQTLVWIVGLAISLLAALSLAINVGNGLRPLARPVLQAFDRLTR